MFKEEYLDYTAQIIIIYPQHLMAEDLHTPWAALYDLHDIPESSISSSLQCVVGSPGQPLLSFVPLLRAGADLSLCYHNHLVQCLKARCEELCISKFT
jgi:hypothetical protein